MASATDEFLAPPAARMGELKPGDELVADNGFTCIEPGSRVTVRADATGALFVPCEAGHHFLDGQLSHDGDDDTLVGLRRAP